MEQEQAASLYRQYTPSPLQFADCLFHMSNLLHKMGSCMGHYGLLVQRPWPLRRSTTGWRPS